MRAAIALVLGLAACGPRPGTRHVPPSIHVSATTGAVYGRIMSTDRAPLHGVIVYASSDALAAPRWVQTDADGVYDLGELPPGEYVLTLYYLEFQIVRTGVDVAAGEATPVYAKIDLDFDPGETVARSER